MSAEEQTEMFRRHAVIVIPANQAALLRDALRCADDTQESVFALASGIPGASLKDAAARARALTRALDRVDFDNLLSVPGERPQDGTE